MADTGKPAPTDKTVLNRPWLVKVTLMLIALIAFGSWGLWDALVVFPNRGEGYASYAEYEYLLKAKEADAEDPTVFPGKAPIGDPVAELAALSDKEEQARNNRDALDSGSTRQLRAAMLVARERWLTGLSRIGQLTPERTNYDSAEASVRLDALRDRWANETPPSELAFYDIPLQWVIVVVCYGFSIYLGFLFIKVASTKYGWDQAEKRLTLPTGEQLVPGDLEDVDKRKWDKFLVFLKIKPDHPSLGGKELKLDLYRHAKLEDWVLQMENEAFPEEAEAERDAAGDEAGDADSDAGDEAEAESTPAS